MKKIKVLLILLLANGLVAQESGKENTRYFVTAAGDTTFCSFLEYETTAQGYLSELEYTDLSGKKNQIKGRKEVPDVVTFCVDGLIEDKIPLEADEPDKYIRYTERVVDGKLKVYSSRPVSHGMVYTPNAPGGDFQAAGPMGKYRFFVKLPDGTYYKINNKKDMNNHIKPYLLKCGEFKNKYQGNFSSDEADFIETIKLYNSLCQ